MKSASGCIASCAVLALLVQVVAGSVEAYEVDTHAQMSLRAVDFSQLSKLLIDDLDLRDGLKQVLSGKRVEDWIAEGSKREDDYYSPDILFRFRRHFHDPLQPWEQAGLRKDKAVEMSSVIWGQSASQAWGWPNVRDYYYEGLIAESQPRRDEMLARTFRGLGHLMHLVQDAASPAHTRNDRHVAYNYETFIDTLRQEEPSTLSGFLGSPISPDRSWTQYPPNGLAPLPIARLIDTDRYVGNNPALTTERLMGMAEYTNANFFSEDRTFPRYDDPSNSYPYPTGSSVEPRLLPIRLPHGEDVKRWYWIKTADGDEGYRLATVGMLRYYLVKYALDPTRRKDAPALDEMVYRDYAAKLIPRAVGSSAALLDYFFRGQFDLWVTQVQMGEGGLYRKIRMRNRTPGEAMRGSLALYYDTVAGERVFLTYWPVDLAPDGEADLGFLPTPVPNQPSAQAGRYLAVFGGELGVEPRAVAARWVHLGAGYVRIPPFVWHCLYPYAGETDCRFDYPATGREVAPQADGTLQFAGADTFAQEFNSLTNVVGVGNVSDGIRRPVVVYREGPAATLQVSVVASGAAYGSPCFVQWGTLLDPVDALGVMTYQDWPSGQSLGSVYFPSSGTYTFSVGPEAGLFSFHAGVPIFPAPPPGGTSSGAVQCTLTSIRFLPS